MATNREKVLELASDQTLARVPAEYNGFGETVEPHCGDVMRIYLQVNPRQMVVDAGFTISEGACAPVVASAALAAKLALDKPVMAAYTIPGAYSLCHHGRADPQAGGAGLCSPSPKAGFKRRRTIIRRYGPIGGYAAIKIIPIWQSPASPLPAGCRRQGD